MKPTLTALFYGQLCPADALSANHDHRRRLHELDTAVTRNLEALREALPKQAHALLDGCMDTMYERQAISETDAFINGFSLGVKIITEAEAEY